MERIFNKLKDMFSKEHFKEFISFNLFNEITEDNKKSYIQLFWLLFHVSLISILVISYQRNVITITLLLISLLLFGLMFNHIMVNNVKPSLTAILSTNKIKKNLAIYSLISFHVIYIGLFMGLNFPELVNGQLMFYVYFFLFMIVPFILVISGIVYFFKNIKRNK